MVQIAQTQDHELLTVLELAEYLTVSADTVYDWNHRKEGQRTSRFVARFVTARATLRIGSRHTGKERMTTVLKRRLIEVTGGRI